MALKPEAVQALREEVGGPVFLRGDAGYQDEIDGFNSLSPMAPEIVVGVTDESDVGAAVRFARTHALEITVQATGHGSYRPVDSGLLIRTQRLDDISVDPQAHTFTIGAGARWMEILPRLSEHGLAAVTGSSPSVGAVGLILGGGVGPLSRTLGWAADRVISFRVVSADGELVVASAAEHPELFQALKGGKVGLGVVTEATIQALPMTHVFGGGLFFAEEHIETIHRAWLDWLPTLSEASNTSLAILRMPPEGVPEPLAGRTLVHVRFAYVDLDATNEQLEERGAQALAPLRAAAPVHLDGVGLLAADQVGTIHAEPFGPFAVWEHGEFLDQVDQDYVTTILEHAGAGVPAQFASVETRYLGGAIARDTALPNSIGGRQAKFSLLVVAAVIPGVNDEILSVAGPALFDAVSANVHAELNYNWAGHPAPEAFARLWPTDVAERLTATRARYDPDRRFVY